jgi:hypothetical protein
MKHALACLPLCLFVQMVLVCTNLKTHTPAALYEAFAPAEARHLAKRFEWHDTPKHGSCSRLR